MKMKEGRLKATVSNLIWSVYSMAVTAIFPFVIRTVLIRFIGLEYAGVGSLFTSILQVINLTDLGFESAVTYFLYKPMSKQSSDSREYACMVLQLLRKLYFCAGVISLVIGAVCLPILPKLILNEKYPDDLNIYIVYIVYVINSVIPYFFGNYKAVLFKANQKGNVLNCLGGTTAGLMYFFQIAALVIWRNFYIFTVFLLIGNTSYAILLKIYSKKYYPQYKAQGWPQKEFLRKFKIQVLSIALSKFRNVTRNSFDSIVISMFLGLVCLAKYQNYYQVMQLIMYVVVLLRIAVTPSLGNGIATESVDSNYGVLTIYTFLQFAILNVLIGGSINLYQPFIVLWAGKKSLLPFYIVVLFCIYIFVYAISDIMILLRETTGIWSKGKWIYIIESLSNLILNVLLVKKFGVAGVIIATITTILCINIPFDLYCIFTEYFEGKFWDYIKQLLWYMLTIIVSTIVVYKIGNYIEAQGILGLILKGITSILISSVIFVIFQLKNPKLMETLRIFKRITKGYTD